MQVALGFGAIPHSVSSLRPWVLSRASLINTSVKSNSLFLGFPDFKGTSWGGGGGGRFCELREIKANEEEENLWKACKG